MSRAAETQNEIIERWKADLTRIARTIHHPNGEGARRECVDLGDVLNRLGVIVGEAFEAGAVDALSRKPLVVGYAIDEKYTRLVEDLLLLVNSHRPLATGGRVSSIPLAGERQGCGEPLTAETLKAARDRLLENTRYMPGPLPDRPQPINTLLSFADLIADPNVPEGTVYAFGSCSCAHRALDHGPNGCLYRAEPLGDICPCSTPVTRLASKATGTGEQP